MKGPTYIEFDPNLDKYREQYKILPTFDLSNNNLVAMRCTKRNYGKFQPHTESI